MVSSMTRLQAQHWHWTTVGSILRVVYLADMDRDFGPLNEAYVDFLKTNSSTPPPSRTCIQAGKLPGAGIIVEIECIAAA